jgi:hypothetical protein
MVFNYNLFPLPVELAEAKLRKKSATSHGYTPMQWTYQLYTMI